MHRHAVGPQRSFNTVCLRSYSVKPERKAVIRPSSVFRVGLDKCFIIMGNAPIARIENNATRIFQLTRKIYRDQSLTKRHWRGISLESNPVLRNTHRCQSTSLIDAKHFELVNAATPEPGQPEYHLSKRSAPSSIDDKTFRMKVRDAINKVFVDQNVERSNEMQHQGWTTRK